MKSCLVSGQTSWIQTSNRKGLTFKIAKNLLHPQFPIILLSHKTTVGQKLVYVCSSLEENTLSVSYMMQKKNVSRSFRIRFTISARASLLVAQW